MVLKKTTLTSNGQYYFSVYQISYDSLFNDVSSNFSIPTIYGPVFDKKCIVGIGSFYVSIFVDYKGYFFNLKTSPIS